MVGGGGQGGSCFAASVYLTLKLADRCKAWCKVHVQIYIEKKTKSYPMFVIKSKLRPKYKI